MSVYLDDANILWRGKQWCHLYADSCSELEKFARSVGLKQSWLQNGDGSGLPHYDVAGQMLDRCVMLGAVLVTGGDGTYRRLRRALAAGSYDFAPDPSVRGSA